MRKKKDGYDLTGVFEVQVYRLLKAIRVVR